jgi:hypothetical protein
VPPHETRAAENERAAICAILIGWLLKNLPILADRPQPAPIGRGARFPALKMQEPSSSFWWEVFHSNEGRHGQWSSAMTTVSGDEPAFVTVKAPGDVVIFPDDEARLTTNTVRLPRDRPSTDVRFKGVLYALDTQPIAFDHTHAIQLGEPSASQTPTTSPLVSSRRRSGRMGRDGYAEALPT